MGFILFVISILLRIPIVFLGIVYGLFKSFYKNHIGNGFKNANLKFLVIATSIDKYGNVVCMELFNDVLIKQESKYKFGKINQTISAIIGYNLKYNTLTKFGLFINKILNFFEKGHCLKAMEED